MKKYKRSELTNICHGYIFCVVVLCLRRRVADTKTVQLSPPKKYSMKIEGAFSRLSEQFSLIYISVQKAQISVFFGHLSHVILHSASSSFGGHECVSSCIKHSAKKHIFLVLCREREVRVAVVQKWTKINYLSSKATRMNW